MGIIKAALTVTALTWALAYSSASSHARTRGNTLTDQDCTDQSTQAVPARLCACTPIDPAQKNTDRTFDLAGSKTQLASFINGLMGVPGVTLSTDALVEYQLYIKKLLDAHQLAFNIGRRGPMTPQNWQPFLNAGITGIPSGTIFDTNDSEPQKMDACEQYGRGLIPLMQYAAKKAMNLGDDPTCADNCTIKITGITPNAPLIVPDPLIKTGYKISKQVVMPNPNYKFPAGTKDEDKLRQFIVANLERKVRMILAGSTQFKKDLNPSAPENATNPAAGDYKGPEVKGVTQGYVTDLNVGTNPDTGQLTPITRMFSDEFKKEGECDPLARFGFAIRKNQIYKIFKVSENADDYAEYADISQGVRNHMCPIARHNVTDENYLSGARQRGVMILAMWKVFLTIKEQILKGQIPDVPDFMPGDPQGGTCSFIKSRILAGRKDNQARLERIQNMIKSGNGSTSSSVNEASLECGELDQSGAGTAYKDTSPSGNGSSIQKGNGVAACYIDANRHIVEAQWTGQYAECVWRTVAFTLFDFYMRQMVADRCELPRQHSAPSANDWRESVFGVTKSGPGFFTSMLILITLLATSIRTLARGRFNRNSATVILCLGFLFLNACSNGPNSGSCAVPKITSAGVASGYLAIANGINYPFQKYCTERCKEVQTNAETYVKQNNALLAELDKTKSTDEELKKRLLDRNVSILAEAKADAEACPKRTFTYYGSPYSHESQDIASNACVCHSKIGNNEPTGDSQGMAAFNKNRDATDDLEDKRSGARRTELLGEQSGLTGDSLLKGKPDTSKRAITAIGSKPVTATGDGPSFTISSDTNANRPSLENRGDSSNLASATNGTSGAITGITGSSSGSDAKSVTFRGSGSNANPNGADGAVMTSGSSGGMPHRDGSTYDSMTSLLGIQGGPSTGASASDLVAFNKANGAKGANEAYRSLASARSSDDPDDYFTRIASHESLFVQVERCYNRHAPHFGISSANAQ